MIKVVVAEDSQVVRELLVRLLEGDPDIRVVATAGDGEAALAAVYRYRPDVVTMDIHMPKLNGLAATRRIMETQPTPIVIVSGSRDTDENMTSFLAMEAGALAVLPRPAGLGHAEHETGARELRLTVRLMAEVKLVRRWPQERRNGIPASPAPATDGAAPRLIAIGASTGGPPVLHTILTALPKDLPVPIVIVQHMASGFIGSFIDWLAGSSALPVELARDGQLPQPGRVYLAPDGVHTGMDRSGAFALTSDDPEEGLRPAIGYLFRSLPAAYGNAVVAGLLSGMGKDGARELKMLKDSGATTFVQDRESAVVHGMAGEALRLEAATHVLAPDGIAALLAGCATLRRGGG